MRRLALRLLAAVLALGALLASPAMSGAATPNYLHLAKQGIKEARKKSNYWNPSLRWYNDRLNDKDQFPLATAWSLVPLMEAIEGVALAEPTKANKKNVAAHAKHAEKYWNPDLLPHGGYAPYPGDRGKQNHVWMDDNSWWGLQFVDAYRVTKNKRFLTDARRANDFVDARGWAGNAGGLAGGMRWNTFQDDRSPPTVANATKSLEALAAATALAAELYQYTGDTKYRDRAHKYLNWANQHARDAKGLYENETQRVMTYVEGPIIGANMSLCSKGEKDACSQAELIARAMFDRTNGAPPNFGPQFDTIFFRFLVQLAKHDHNVLWWQWASNAAQQAIANAHDTKHPTLYLKFWDGTSATALQHQVLQMQYGQIQTHAAAVALFAWLAAFPRP